MQIKGLQKQKEALLAKHVKPVYSLPYKKLDVITLDGRKMIECSPVPRPENVTKTGGSLSATPFAFTGAQAYGADHTFQAVGSELRGSTQER